MLGRVALLFLAALVGVANVSAESGRKVIIDQDCRAPATTDLLSTLALIQSPETDVLAVSVVSPASPDALFLTALRTPGTLPPKETP